MRIIVLKSRVKHLGGLERYAVAIAKSFAQKGAHTTLLTTDSVIDIPNVEVVSLGAHPSLNIQAVHFFDKAAQKWLEKHSYDIVFGLDRNSFQTHYRAGNGLHKTFLKQKCKGLLSKLISKINPKERLILKKEQTLFNSPSLQTLFTNSKMVKEDLLKTYQVDSQKIQVVHNGVDFEKFAFNQHSKLQSLQNLGLEERGSKLLFIGNNYKRKGLKLILETLSTFSSWDFHLMVVGQDKNEKKYETLAEKLDLSKKITFYGHQKDLIPFYQSSDCLILPSFYDPFANVTIEALAMGLFVITSQFNGGGEVLTAETGTILKNLNSPPELRCALIKFKKLKMDFQMRQSIRKTIQHLDINSQINRIVDLTLNSRQ